MTLVELLPFAAIAAAFWLLIIRPASVRRKAQAALVASLAPGQRIMTTAGVFGTVVAIDGDRVSVEVAPGVVIEMLAAGDRPGACRGTRVATRVRRLSVLADDRRGAGSRVADAPTVEDSPARPP